MKVFIFSALFLCTGGLFAQFIVEDTGYTVEELVRDVLVDSNCAETSNYTSFTGIEERINGIGYFNANNTDFPYQEGIILSTGSVRDAKGPNIGINDSGSEEWPGDDDLRAITNTSNLFNATYIKFDFIPQANRISFNFLFASEEYQENYQCIYSDVFAFILTDSNGVSTNLAIIPNTDLPVRATTIRPGIRGECAAQNVDFFDQINDRSAAISFHGQTKSLKAESPVNSGEKYSIKLVISDNRDSQVDSAVFLEAGSFSLGLDLGSDRTVANGNPACIGEAVPLNAFVEGVVDYRWYKDDVEVTSWAGNSRVDLVEEGDYRVDLVFSETCISNGNLFVEFIAPPEVKEMPLDMTACDVDGNGNESFDFSANTTRILGGQDATIYQVTYYNSERDARTFTNPISNIWNYVTDGSEIIYARISSNKSCYEIVSFQLKIQNLDFETALEDEYLLCLDSQGNILGQPPLLDTGLLSTDYAFTWYKERITPANLIVGAIDPNYSASSVGRYHIVLQNLTFGCEFSISTQVVTSQQPDVFEVVFVSDLFSNNNTVDIVAEGTGEYLFSIDGGEFGSGNRFGNLDAGEHITAVTDSYGCSILEKEFTIVDFPRFFTPNGDGVNDTWDIVGFPEIESAEISIFNKYGTFIYRLDNTGGWDGRINGNEAPSSDYWFKISYVRGNLPKEFKSHFTLKR